LVQRFLYFDRLTNIALLRPIYFDH